MNENKADLREQLKQNAQDLAEAGQLCTLPEEKQGGCPMQFRVAADLRVRLKLNARICEIAFTEQDLRRMVGQIVQARKCVAENARLHALIKGAETLANEVGN